MGEDGLAFQATQGGQSAGSQMPAQSSATAEMIQEIVAMLLSGVSPEELIQQGVPVEIVEEAMAIALAQTEGVGQQQTPMGAPTTSQAKAPSFDAQGLAATAIQ